MHRKPIFDLQCLGVSCGSRLDILDEGLGVRSDLPQQIRRVGTCATLPHHINLPPRRTKPRTHNAPQSTP